MTNPYSQLPPYHFWRRSVSNVCRHEFDPVTNVRFTIARHDRVATAGSCFAQHISRHLDQIGFNYYVVEDGSELAAAERKKRNFGVFSARYGNIYTARQLLQVFREAFGRLERRETAWARPDGRFVDPYRPQIEPEGFAHPDDVRAAREAHLASVRTMFEEADVFVFTLGLTEGWAEKADGSVFPLAPGVAGGTYDPERYAPVNFTVFEVHDDLHAFLQELRDVNKDVRVLLTVSPVPLMATFEDRNVLVATTYSKSVLRVAADHIYRNAAFVDYFPSYEIITGSYNFGMYYEEDAREVNDLGVSHAMRVFLRNYARSEGERPAARIEPPADFSAVPSVVCDEEAIDRINR